MPQSPSWHLNLGLLIPCPVLVLLFCSTREPKLLSRVGYFYKARQNNEDLEPDRLSAGETTHDVSDSATSTCFEEVPIVPWDMSMLEQSRNREILLRVQLRAAVTMGQSALPCRLTQL